MLISGVLRVISQNEATCIKYDVFDLLSGYTRDNKIDIHTSEKERDVCDIEGRLV